jgi:hypothetical protein
LGVRGLCPKTPSVASHFCSGFASFEAIVLLAILAVLAVAYPWGRNGAIGLFFDQFDVIEAMAGDELRFTEYRINGSAESRTIPVLKPISISPTRRPSSSSST